MSLNTKFSDLKLALQLWFFAWICATAAIFAGLFYYLKRDEVAPQIWTEFLLAKAASGVGFGHVRLPYLEARPDMILTYTHQKFLPEIVQNWHSDFLILAQSPALAAGLLILVFLLFRKGN